MDEVIFLRLIVMNQNFEKCIEAKEKGEDELRKVITFEPKIAEIVEKLEGRLESIEKVGIKEVANNKYSLVRTNFENALFLCANGYCIVDKDCLLEIRKKFDSKRKFIEFLRKKFDEIKEKSSEIDFGTVFPEEILKEIEEVYIEEKKRTKKEAIEGEEKEKGFVEIKLSTVSADLIGHKVKFKAQVVGYSVGRAVERRLIIKCSKCLETLEEIDLEREENFEFFYLMVRNRELLLKKLKSTNPLLFGFCSEDKPHKIVVESSKEYSDYSILEVRELPENIRVPSLQEYLSLASKTWHVIYKGIIEDIKRVEIVAYVVKNPRTNELEFVAYDIEPLEEEFVAKRFTKEDHEIFKKYFNKENLEKIIKYQFAPWIVKRDLAKLSALLTLHSPYRIPDISGKLIRGCLRTIWFGDTKTGKSEIGKDITLYYKIGEYTIGESSSRAGLLYNIDTENRIIIWGTLPLNDRKFVFLDGIHTLSYQEVKEFRESLEQEMVKVDRMVKGVKNARVRIIATFNPNIEMMDLSFKVCALKNIDFFKNPPDITRWDIFIPFSHLDVDAEEIAKSQIVERPVPFSIFIDHIKWVWSLEPGQIKYSEEAKEFIIKYSAEFMKKYSNSSIPIIHNGFRDTLTRISVSFAVLLHSVEFGEEKEYVIVRPEHVEESKRFIESVIEALELDVFLDEINKREKIPENELQKILGELKEKHIEILKLLKFEPKSSKELGAIFNVTDRAIRDWLLILKRHNLIESSPGFGVRLTRKGMQLLKIIEEKQNKKDNEKIEKLSEPRFGICEFCGERKLLKYKHQDRLMCEDCYQNEILSK